MTDSTNTGTKYEFNPQNARSYSDLLGSLRGDMREEGFVEIQTPILSPVELGFNPPISTEETSHGEKYSLRTAPMVSPIMGEFDKFFELGPCFRDEMGENSSPEYNVHLFVESGSTYEHGREQFQELVENAAEAVNGDTMIEYQGEQFDLSNWRTITWEEAFDRYADLDESTYQDPAALEKYVDEELDIDVSQNEFSDSPNHLYHDWLLDQVLESKVEDNLMQPTFLVNPPYHFEVPSAGIEGTNHKQTADPYVSGTEIGHIRTVQTDGNELREWHERTAGLKEERGIEDALDEDYLELMDDLEDEPIMLGAVGVDRLAMMLLDEQSIEGVRNFNF